MIRKFTGIVEVDFEIELDQSVFDNVDDSFREHIYNLQNDRDVLEMIVCAMLRKWTLSQMDGWANLPDENAFMIDENWELISYKEIKNENQQS